MIVTLPKLHEAQLTVVRGLKRFNVLACGRRWGKTRLCVLLSLKEMFNGGAVQWIAPSYPIAEIGWRLIKFFGEQIPGVQVNLSDKRLTFKSGWVQVKSAEARGGLRGEGLTLLIADEAAHIVGFKDIWEQELRPSLTDRKGRAIFISTPKGLNYFSDLFNTSGDEWARWQMPSSTNPYLDPDEIDDARRLLPELVFRQEYLAEFVQLSGAMFKREYFDKIITSAPEYVRQARHWDLAASTKTTADKSAGVRVGLEDNGDAVIHHAVSGRWAWPDLVKVIKQTALSDGPEIVQTIETVGTQKGMLDLLLAEPQLAGITFRGITPIADKIARANVWLARAEQKKIKLMAGEWNGEWLDEICSFPEGDHDDLVDATSGAFASFTKTPLTFETVIL